MKRTRPLDLPSCIRVGRTWLFADGTRLPVVAGADGDEGDNASPVVPDDLSDKSDEDLEALEAQLVSEFDRLHDEGSRDVEAFEAIAQALDRIHSEQDARAEQEQEAAAKIAALHEKVHPKAEGEGDDGEGDDPDDGDDPGDGDPAGDDGGESADAPKAGEKEKAKEPVAASAARPARQRASASGTARRAQRPAVGTARNRVTITAAADIPGIAANDQIDLTQVAVAMHDRARSLSTQSPRVPIAAFHMPFAPENVVGKHTSSVQLLDMLDRVAAPPTSVDSLVAAGWCTPSQNMYELLALEGTTGLLDIPAIGIDRGGVNVPSYIGIDAADGALWSWSEDQDNVKSFVLTANDVAGAVGTADSAVNHLLQVGDMVNIRGGGASDGPHTVTAITDANTFTYDATGVADGSYDGATAVRQKGCFRIPCPTWTDVRLAAYGLCIEHGTLTDRAFPELTRRYVQLALAAHMHRLSAIQLAKILTNTHSDAVTVTAVGSDSFGELVNALALQIADYRSQHKIGANVVLEVAVPSWVPEMLVANMAMRPGVDLIDVQRARIIAAVTRMNTRVQFLEDYQAMWDGTAATAWPASLQFVIWPAGSIIEGNSARIDLGVVRDRELIRTNDFTAAWTEDFRLLFRRGPKARRVTCTLSTDGITGCCP